VLNAHGNVQQDVGSVAMEFVQQDVMDIVQQQYQIILVLVVIKHVMQMQNFQIQHVLQHVVQTLVKDNVEVVILNAMIVQVEVVEDCAIINLVLQDALVLHVIHHVVENVNMLVMKMTVKAVVKMVKDALLSAIVIAITLAVIQRTIHLLMLVINFVLLYVLTTA
jgi:hypothetical protein